MKRIGSLGSCALLSSRALFLSCALGVVACDKSPPPPLAHPTDAATATSDALGNDPPPTSAASTVMCFGAICAKDELCFDASHAQDAAAPYECFTIPAPCAEKPSCDCLLAHHEFSCPAPNHLLCSENGAGGPQVVCVMLFE